MSTWEKVYESCEKCQGYAARRQKVLVPAMVATRRRTGESTQEVIDRFMGGVHARHLAGGSL